MRNTVFGCTLAALVLSGCSNPLSTISPQSRVDTVTSPVSHEKTKRFHAAMIKVAKSTKNDPNYHRIALATDEEKQWFKNLMYKLWDREITRQQFISEGIRRYPSHRYEFTYIANAYQNY